MSRLHRTSIIVILIAILGGISFYFWQLQKSNTTIAQPNNNTLQTINQPTQVDTSATALLIVEKGQVAFTRAGNTKMIADEQEIAIGDEIKTQSNSTAIIIFPDNDILRMATNTEITLVTLTSSDLESAVVIDQITGSTWSHVTPLLDRKRHYQVETPTLVATVRGTTFNVSIENSQDSWVGVNESQVGVMRKNDSSWVEVKPGEFTAAKTNVSEAMYSEKMPESMLSSPWFKENINKDSAMQRLLSSEAKKPMPKNFLRDNRASIFIKAGANSIVSPTVTTTITESVVFNAETALVKALNTLVERKQITRENADQLLQDIKIRENIRLLKSAEELLAFLLDYIQHLNQPTSPDPSQNPTPTNSPTVSASASSTPTTTPSPTHTPETKDTQTSPSPSTSPTPSSTTTVTTRPTFLYTPRSNYFYYSPTPPTNEEIR